MIEGWHNDDYLILFDPVEAARFGEAYELPTFLPGYRLIGLRSWDDLIVVDPLGTTLTVPTVPIVADYLKPFALPTPPVVLGTDSRVTGKIKWYIKPIAFGGDPKLGENVCWIGVDQHSAAVKWWNHRYRELSSSQGSKRGLE